MLYTIVIQENLNFFFFYLSPQDISLFRIKIYLNFGKWTEVLLMSSYNHFSSICCQTDFITVKKISTYIRHKQQYSGIITFPIKTKFGFSPLPCFTSFKS